jgi:outer membrane biosynthesis protein TonB
LLLGVAGSAYLHLALFLLILGWGPIESASAGRLLPGPVLGVTLTAPRAPAAAAAPPAESAPKPSPPKETAPPRPKPAPPPEPPPPEQTTAVRELPPEREEEPEKEREPQPVPAAAEPEESGEEPDPGSAAAPSGVEGAGAVATADGGGGLAGGLEGVAGAETYNQRVATILSNFIPWNRLVLPAGSPARRMTVAFVARIQGGRAGIERVLVAEPSGYERFDLAVERAVREMATLPLPAGHESEYLYFRYQVVLLPPGETLP